MIWPKLFLFVNIYSHYSKEYFIELGSSIPNNIFVALEVSDAVHWDVALRVKVLQVHLFDAHKSDIMSVLYTY